MMTDICQISKTLLMKLKRHKLLRQIYFQCFAIHISVLNLRYINSFPTCDEHRRTSALLLLTANFHISENSYVFPILTPYRLLLTVLQSFSLYEEAMFSQHLAFSRLLHWKNIPEKSLSKPGHRAPEGRMLLTTEN